MKIVKYLRLLFEKLNKEELIYESEKIYRGELKALDGFISRAEINQNNPKYGVEELLFDSFFEADNLNNIYSEFIEKHLEIEEKEEANRTEPGKNK